RAEAEAATSGDAVRDVEAPPLTHGNGLGGFTAGGREYAIVLEGDADTPLPWVNVIANERFGTLVGATGAAWTWCDNSRENRLTPFANDPVGEFSGEALYLRDEDQGLVWGATPGPLPRGTDPDGWRSRMPACARPRRPVTGSSSWGGTARCGGPRRWRANRWRIGSAPASIRARPFRCASISSRARPASSCWCWGRATIRRTRSR